MRFAGRMSAARGRRVLAVCLASAAGGLGTLVPQLAERLNPPPPPGPVQELRDIFRHKRPLKARLEGFDFWEPCDKPRCEPFPIESPEFSRLAQLGGRLKSTLEPTNQELRALALWHLVAPDGEIDKSVRLLERLSYQVEGRELAMVLSDLSAAYSTRGELKDDFRDVIRALDAVERQLVASPGTGPITARLGTEALLGLSPFELRGGSGVAGWPLIKREVVVDAIHGRRERVRKALVNHASEAFDFVELELLGQLVEAIDAHRPEEAARLQTVGAALADALRLTTGDRFLDELFQDLPPTPALRAFSAGRVAYSRREIGEAKAQFETVTSLVAKNTGLALWSRFYLAAAGHWTGGGKGLADLQAVSSDVPLVGYGRLKGYVAWMRGVFESEREDLATAAASYEEAAAKLLEASLEGPAVSLDAILASESLRRGDLRSAAARLRRVLPRLGQIPSLGHRATAYEVGTDLAELLACPYAGLRFQDEAVKLARDLQDPSALVQSLERRARIRDAVGDRPGAAGDLLEARTAAGLLRDAAGRRLLDSILLVAAGQLSAGDVGPSAVADLTEAIAQTTEASGVDLVPELLSRRAAIHLRDGRQADAAEDWQTALALVDKLVGSGRASGAGRVATTRWRRVVDEAVGGYLEMGRNTDAYLAAARLRVWRLVPFGGPVPTGSATLPQLDSDEELVGIHLLPGRLVRWSFFAGSCDVEELPLPAAVVAAEGHLSLPDSPIWSVVAGAIFGGSRSGAKKLRVALDPAVDLIPLQALRSQVVGPLGFDGLSLEVGAGRALKPPVRPSIRTVVVDPTTGTSIPLTAAREFGAGLPRGRAGMRVLTGPGASQAAILTALSRSAEFYYTGHYQRSATPWGRGGLATASGDVVSESDIRRMDLRGVSLVVLAACGDQVEEESGTLRSIALSLIARGVDQVIVAQVAVSDRGAAELLRSLLPLLEQELSPSNALFRVQSEPRSDETTRVELAAFDVLRGG